MRLRCLALLLLALAALLGNPAQAASTHIAARLVAERSSAAPGETVMLAFDMRPDRGWHGYWVNPGDAGLGLTLAWELPAGAQAGELSYPVPGTLLVSGLMNHVYERDYAVLVPLTLPATVSPGTTLPIAVEAQWLACTDEICVPEQARLSTAIRVGPPSPADRRFDAWRRALPAPMADMARFALDSGKVRLAVPLPADLPLDDPHLFLETENVADYAAPQSFSRSGNLLIVELARARNSPGTPGKALSGVLRLGQESEAGGLAFTAMPGPVPAGGEPVGAAAEPFSAGRLAALLGLALLGGLLLNVMPCVFPILSIKALALAGTGNDRARVRRDGLAYTAGVLIACLGLGGLMLALRAAGEDVGWAFQLQEPLVVAGLLLLALAITANFAGLYELPALWTGTGERGAFATGLLAAFVATPCTGPFMAAAMGAALVLPSAAALAVFAALGLGLALPFLTLALVPALRHALPKPGRWMAGFRRAMAVPMGLTALALVWLASRTGGLAFAATAAILGVVLLGILALVGRTQRRGHAALPRTVPAFAALALAAVAALPLTQGEPLAASADGLRSSPFSTAALASARRADRPVFVYFTADWCLTCKVNESAAIDREATREAFDRARVKVLRGDWTRRDPALTRFLAEHEAAGVPLYLWYRPGATQPEILPQLLTTTMLTALSSRSTDPA